MLPCTYIALNFPIKLHLNTNDEIKYVFILEFVNCGDYVFL